jgi:hypothetical protein
MAVQVWLGEKPDNPNERKAIIALANGLDRLEGLYLMIANFSVGGRTIDLVILKRDAIFIMELKHCDGQVFGSVNGPWKVVSKGGSTKLLNPGRKNPYNQVISYFYSFTNFLNDHKTDIVSTQKANDIDFRTAKRVIVIVPTIEPGSQINLDWKVQAKGLDELPTFLLTERSNGIELTDEELQRIPKLLHCQPWQELNNLLVGVMPAWTDTPPDLTNTPPPEAAEPDTQATLEPSSPTFFQREWWASVVHQINTWPARVLTAFTLITLILMIMMGSLLISSYWQNTDTAPPIIPTVPTIPDIGLAENISNGIAEVHQSVARRWDWSQRTWVTTASDDPSAEVVVTLETADFNNEQIKINWTVENRSRRMRKMSLVPDNITVIDNNHMVYMIDPDLSQPAEELEVKPETKASAAAVVPYAVRPNAITLRITLLHQPYSETSWIVNVPQR